jgi:SAM-dependent methyltransferase
MHDQTYPAGHEATDRPMPTAAAAPPSRRDWRAAVHRAELELTLPVIQHTAACDLADLSLLEVGAGDGHRLASIRRQFWDVQGIDVAAGDGVACQHRVLGYDGRHIPFPDDSFDVIFSASVLQHVRDLEALLADMARVLRPKGFMVHLMPTHVWRAATTLTHPLGGAMRLARRYRNDQLRITSMRQARHGLARVLPPRHGARGNALTEFGYFHPAWWRRTFARNGWQLRASLPTGLFYGDSDIFRAAWSLEARKRATRYFGSACQTYVLSRG